MPEKALKLRKNSGKQSGWHQGQTKVKKVEREARSRKGGGVGGTGNVTPAQRIESERRRIWH